MYLKNSGMADTAYFGAEAEFFIFDNVRFDQTAQLRLSTYIDAEEGRWNSGRAEHNLGYRPRYKEGYFPVPPTDHYQDLRAEMVETMIKCGLNIECHHHEVATAGQCEIDQRFDTLVKSADNMMIYKYVIRNVAYQYGKTVTFMPKPLFGDNGSGMHTHQSLWKDKKPLFAGDLYAGFSQMALVVHRRTAEARAGAVGDHRAHHQQLQAPGAGLRSSGEPGLLAAQSLGRLPHSDVLGQSQGQARRVPAARSFAAIRYLAFAAMLMAGLDGVLNKIDPGEPLDKDIYDLSPEEMKAVPSMPASLEEALSAPRRGPRLPAQGRRVQRGADRDLHRLQAQERGRRHPPAPASVRVRAVLRHLGACPRKGPEGHALA